MPPQPFGRALEWLCGLLALSGGAVLAVLTVMSAVSIGGRALGRPIQGDYELMQFGCAVAVALFLPYCQFKRGNIIVDFFTVRSGRRLQGALDAFGALLLALVMVLLAWRTAAGTSAMKASGETSMLMGVPLWYAYALLTPSFALTAIAGLYTVWQSWRDGDRQP